MEGNLQKENRIIKRILQQYQEKEVSKLDELKALDRKAKRGANIFGYVFGIIGSLILGIGMCIAMEIIFEGYMILGIIIGLIGILMVSFNYTIYKNKLNKGKAKYANQIIEISNQILNE